MTDQQKPLSDQWRAWPPDRIEDGLYVLRKDGRFGGLSWRGASGVMMGDWTHGELSYPVGRLNEITYKEFIPVAALVQQLTEAHDSMTRQGTALGEVSDALGLSPESEEWDLGERVKSLRDRVAALERRDKRHAERLRALRSVIESADVDALGTGVVAHYPTGEPEPYPITGEAIQNITQIIDELAPPQPEKP